MLKITVFSPEIEVEQAKHQEKCSEIGRRTLNKEGSKSSLTMISIKSANL
jgi:hypothetical protein